MRCLTDPDTAFDIAVLGAPFDGAVSYRGGRFTFRFLGAFGGLCVGSLRWYGTTALTKGVKEVLGW